MVNIQQILGALAPNEDFGDEIRNWLQADFNDHGHGILDDEEIVEAARGANEEEVESEPEVIEIDQNLPKISHTQAFDSLTLALQWLEEQPEARIYNKDVLKSLRELAASKRMTGLRQKTLTDFFK